jgi:hypothetical protein
MNPQCVLKKIKTGIKKVKEIFHATIAAVGFMLPLKKFNITGKVSDLTLGVLKVF